MQHIRMSRKGQLYFVGMGVGAAIGLVGWVAFGIGGGNSDVISVCGFTHTTAERRRSGGGEEDNLASAVIMPSYTAIDISGTLLEELTMAAWEEAEQKHLFKSGLDGYAERRTASVPVLLPDGLVVVGNPGRSSKRKGLPQVETVDLSRKFDHLKFHFGKANPEEILFRYNPWNERSENVDNADGRCERYTQPSGADVSHIRKSEQTSVAGHYAIINPFPLGRYSGLVSPFLQEFRSQKMSQDSLEIGLKFASELQSLRVGYNSIGAGASVNHLHFQFWKVNLGLPVETAPRIVAWLVPSNDNHITLSKSAGWYAPFFVWSTPSHADVVGGALAVTALRKKVAAHVQAAVAYLTEINLPHNLVLTPTEVYLFPRRGTVPYVPATDPGGAHVTSGFPEVAGAVICPDTHLFKTLDEVAWLKWFEEHLAPSHAQLEGVMATLKDFKFPDA